MCLRVYRCQYPECFCISVRVCIHDVKSKNIYKITVHACSMFKNEDVRFEVTVYSNTHIVDLSVRFGCRGGRSS